jgi:hypothetical protein
MKTLLDVSPHRKILVGGEENIVVLGGAGMPGAAIGPVIVGAGTCAFDDTTANTAMAHQSAAPRRAAKNMRCLVIDG